MAFFFNSFLKLSISTLRWFTFTSKHLSDFIILLKGYLIIQARALSIRLDWRSQLPELNSFLVILRRSLWQDFIAFYLAKKCNLRLIFSFLFFFFSLVNLQPFCLVLRIWGTTLLFLVYYYLFLTIYLTRNLPRLLKFCIWRFSNLNIFLWSFWLLLKLDWWRGIL